MSETDSGSVDKSSQSLLGCNKLGPSSSDSERKQQTVTPSLKNPEDGANSSQKVKKKKKTTKRKLPGWLTGRPVAPKEKTHKRCEPAFEAKLPVLTFPGKIKYCYMKDECSFTCEDIMQPVLAGEQQILTLGFDIEWPVTYESGREPKTALIQLCPSSAVCYLFHLSCMSGFPGGLKMLLQNEKVKKVGVGIQGDMWKLQRDFDIKMTRIVDLSEFGNQVTNSHENWSLDGLCKHLLCQKLDKDETVRKSDWRQHPLSWQQELYAATDAYASLAIYEDLEKRNSKQIPQTGSKH
ncbi:bifunctional 3'-5' exonuclease/ATP-dependent helicase WRN-like [Glandiceps talaboti]